MSGFYASPNVRGEDKQIQYNENGVLSASSDLIWDHTSKRFGVTGNMSISGVSTFSSNVNVNSDLNISSVGIGTTFTTSLQLISPTFNRVISFPDATGTIGLVPGNSGMIPYNSSGNFDSGNLFYDSSRGTFGYSSTSGGTVTQSSSKSTGVTLNVPCGQITMNGAALSANTTVSFVMTNSSVDSNDVLILNHISGGTVGSYSLNAQPAVGIATINVRNITSGSLSESIVLRFVVIKGDS